MSKKNISRRTFNQLLGAAGAATAVGLAAPSVMAAGKGRVVVIGGGFGGATAANYLKQFDPSLDVTMIEPNKTFVTCPFSNTVIGGLNDISFITQSFDGLRARGVNVVHDMVTMIDAAKKEVTLSSGKTIYFDRCIVSPGIDFKYEAIEGNSAALAETMPHAWKAGPQTSLLRKQLEAMPNGGTFLISPPPNPFRCPPGPGERISLVANYFKQHKPKSKIIVLDPKQKFSKQGLFKEGWAKLYPGMIDYRHQSDDGVVLRVDGDKKTLYTDFGEVTGDVVNLIPAQKAGKIAAIAGLTNDQGWCPINQQTFESTIHKNIHVIGDASVSTPMPKSGFAASTQAKICAGAVVAMLKGEAPGTPKFANTCYSLVSADYGISVAMVYGFADGHITKIKGSGGLSPTGASDSFRKQEANYAEGWYKSITKDIWG
ncbi:MAG: cytochrome C [Rhodospirillaceae bacterium]|nr:MAG: cytochrome C [Rhodospirillaceae bacterium]